MNGFKKRDVRARINARDIRVRMPALVAAVSVVVGAALFASCVGFPGTGGSSSTSSSSGGDGRRASSGSKERSIKSSRRVPEFVKEAQRNVPEDALVGVGFAKMSMDSQSMKQARTRAQQSLSQQISVMVRDMSRDYQASSEIDPSATLAFQENFTLTLSKSNLKGASPIEEDFDDAGAYWVVLRMPKDSVLNEVRQDVAAAKLKVPAFASFNAEARMNDAFDKIAKEDVQVVDN